MDKNKFHMDHEALHTYCLEFEKAMASGAFAFSAPTPSNDDSGIMLNESKILKKQTNGLTDALTF